MLNPTQLTTEEFLLAADNTPGESVEQQLMLLQDGIQCQLHDLLDVEDQREDVQVERTYAIDKLSHELDKINSIAALFQAAKTAAVMFIREHPDFDEHDIKFSQNIMDEIAHLRERKAKPEYKTAQRAYSKAKIDLERAEYGLAISK